MSQEIPNLNKVEGEELKELPKAGVQNSLKPIEVNQAELEAKEAEDEARIKQLREELDLPASAEKQGSNEQIKVDLELVSRNLENLNANWISICQKDKKSDEELEGLLFAINRRAENGDPRELGQNQTRQLADYLKQNVQKIRSGALSAGLEQDKNQVGMRIANIQEQLLTLRRTEGVPDNISNKIADIVGELNMTERLITEAMDNMTLKWKMLDDEAAENYKETFLFFRKSEDELERDMHDTNLGEYMRMSKRLEDTTYELKKEIAGQLGIVDRGRIQEAKQMLQTHLK